MDRKLYQPQENRPPVAGGISEESLDDFIARWKRAFGEDLMRGEARLIAGRVLHLYRELLFRPLPGREDDQDLAMPSTRLHAQHDASI